MKSNSCRSCSSEQCRNSSCSCSNREDFSTNGSWWGYPSDYLPERDSCSCKCCRCPLKGNYYEPYDRPYSTTYYSHDGTISCATREKYDAEGNLMYK